ncbi:pectinesterase-like [Impatiens glandulifera]|uniref:pectinesterase-like n=1 Tax=Impatiens glandulifera TaxID=253017 RepID=UPI001FB1A1E6|nr:pectinesterase-like [Impatiens glandulifera]
MTVEKTDDMRLLLRTVFYAAIEGTRQAITTTSILGGATNAMVDRSSFNICRELLEFSIDDMEKAINRLDHVVSKDNKDQLHSDIMTRLSGSITFQQTCIDEIKNMSLEYTMVQSLKLSRELSSNALAIVANTAFKEDESVMFPSWVIHEINKKKATTLFTVSKDGLGMFNTINEALSEIKHSYHNHIKNIFIIYVKAGVYEEYINIKKNMKNVVLIGDGPTKTTITGNRCVQDGFKTFKTATVIVDGDNFVAKNIAIENTAGPGSQAVALRISGDKSVIYNSHIDGYQDTLYAHAHRQFYRDCTISSTVDFIFGDAAAVFQNCKIVVKRPGPNQGTCTVTAQGRSDKRSSTGFVFQNCTITADKSYTDTKIRLKSFLGRPWRKYSRTMIMESEINDLIDPRGWLPWDGEENLKTLWYGEFLNRGPGADLSQRVDWIGFHKDINERVAAGFVPRRFIDGDHWIPESSIPYFPNFTIPNYFN